MALGAEVATLISRRPFTRLSTLVIGAFGGILLWMVGISVAGLFGGGLPLGLGWLGVGMVVLSIALVGVMARDPAQLRAERGPNPG